jgi:mono/diheme cytochrome c family protein
MNRLAVAVALMLSPLAAHADAAHDAAVARGAYLMNSVVACGNCHTPMGPNGPDMSARLSGRLVDDSPAWTAQAANITMDVATGIGAWTDAEITTAIREGVRPDGTVIRPPMPIGFYRGMSDGDVAALIAYMRTLPAVANAVPDSVYRVPTPPTWGPPTGSVAAPDPSDLVAYGGYIAGPLAHCMECHSAPSPQGGPDTVNGLGAGGMEFHGPWGLSIAANLTPTGLGDWTDAQIDTVIRTGVRPDGTRLKPPMGLGYYAVMAQADMAAIIAYLRALPPK